MHRWTVRRGGRVIGSVERANGPLGVMYEARDRDGKLLSSHGGGTPRDQRRRAYAAVKENADKQQGGA